MKKINFYLLLVILVAGCRDPYDLPLRQTDLKLLVVEGVLNAGGLTTITLSRTVGVYDPAAFVPVLQATLTVESKAGNTFSLSSVGNGRYLHAGLPLVLGQEYRLRIRTPESKEYLSDYVVARPSPPIDSVSWKKENDRVIVYANTHDPTNNTRYYKWDYDETWEIQSYYTASYRWTGGTNIVYAPNYRKYCWKYATSNNILIGSTAQLSADVVSEAPLQFILPGSEKLSVRYSLLLRQQALTKEAYQYLSIMRRNTEAIGSIFDPQPSELRGNIKCLTNPEEIVVGYLTASSFAEKRLFITEQEANWRYSQSCPFITVPNHPDSLRLWLPNYLPFAADERLGTIVSYDLASPTCVDCTTRGGNLSRPAYW